MKNGLLKMIYSVKEKILAGVSSNDIADTLKRKRSAITSRVKHFTDP